MRTLPALLLLCLSATAADSAAIFDPDPQHAWNRLHAFFYTRVAQDGSLYGDDELDPPLAPYSSYFVHGPGHEKALLWLDDFLKTDADALIAEPLKRAILQRDLWEIFDQTAQAASDEFEHQAERRAIQLRLAIIMKRLALLRRALLITSDGSVVVSPLTESLQLRVYRKDFNKTEKGTPEDQDVYEFKLKRRGLLNALWDFKK